MTIKATDTETRNGTDTGQLDENPTRVVQLARSLRPVHVPVREISLAIHYASRQHRMKLPTIMSGMPQVSR